MYICKAALFRPFSLSPVDLKAWPHILFLRGYVHLRRFLEFLCLYIFGGSYYNKMITFNRLKNRGVRAKKV